jgi:putative addiction module component (TIGR02574 family)
MHTTRELFKEAESLPVEERVLLTESLLKTLHAPDRSIEKEWYIVAQRRLSEIKNGKVKPVSGEEVFRKIRNRFEK